jgi:succinate-semialdehyde dehydrogenase/glutarate-semialdehyde dehydrogenase
MIATINPATGETLREFPALSAGAIEEKVNLAWTTFHSYRHTPWPDRARALQKAAEILETEKRELGTLMTTEMGKTLGSAIAEAEKCAWACRYYAENGERLLADEHVQTSASRSLVRYQPLGPVLAVMPWNFPFWQVFRFAAPALAAGNTGLLKHAGNVPQCALAIAGILHRAGFPEGAFQTLLIEADQVDALLHDDRVVAATLTGSELAGRSVARASGGQVKKTVLELGGSDPFIVMPSADFEEAVTMAVKARVIANGQSCIAAKRFIVADAIYDAFQNSFVERMKALKVGDPMAPDTEVGPLATAKIRDGLHDQVQRAVAAGGHLLAGGRKIDGRGFYYEPTVLVDVPRSSPVSREEFFGPVAMLFRARDAKAAIELANDSPFGLGCSVWTRDASEQSEFEEGIEAGQVYVNAMVASDPRLPFGGVKRSGYGRELGVWGIREFVNVKTIWCK